MERDSFIFYRSFYEATKDLEKEEKANVLDALCEYALNGNNIEPKGIAKVVFAMAKPQLDANNERRINGTKGGRPKKTNGYEIEKPMVIETKTNGYEIEKPNVNDNDNVNVNVNVNANDKEKEEKEKSSAFFESFLDLYEIKPDISSLTTVRDLDFKKVLKAWGESKWLKTEIKSLRWVVNNYQKIISGEYKDKATYKAKEEEPKEESEYDKKRKKNLEIIKKSSHEWGFDSGVACFLGLDLDYIKEGDLPIPIEQYKRETA